MSTETVKDQRPPTDAEILDRVIKKREAEPATKADQSTQEASPADPNVTPEPAPVPEKKYASLDDVLPEDFENGFFRGKPLKELYHSYRATETEMQKAQRERNELRELTERLRAEVAARDVAIQTVRRPLEQSVDPYAEVEAKWFEDPRAAMRKLQEITLEQARQELTAETQRTRQETAAEAQKRQLLEQGGRAYDEARTALNLDADTWNKRAKAVLVELTDPNGPYASRGGPLVRDFYVEAYRGIFGDPTPAQPAPTPVVVAAAPAVVANPPGSKKAVVGSATPNAGLPTLSEETAKALRQVALGAGLSKDEAEKFLEKQRARKARAMGGR